MTDISEKRPTSIFKVDRSSEMSVMICKNIRRYIPEDSNRHSHYCDNIKYWDFAFIVTLAFNGVENKRVPAETKLLRPPKCPRSVIEIQICDINLKCLCDDGSVTKQSRHFIFISTLRYGSALSNCLKLNYCDILEVTGKMLIQRWNFLLYGQAMVIKHTTVEWILSECLNYSKIGLMIITQGYYKKKSASTLFKIFLTHISFFFVHSESPWSQNSLTDISCAVPYSTQAHSKLFGFVHSFFQESNPECLIGQVINWAIPPRHEKGDCTTMWKIQTEESIVSSIVTALVEICRSGLSLKISMQE